MTSSETGPVRRRKRRAAPEVRSTRRRITLDHGLAAALVAVSFAAAIAFGSVDPRAVAIWVAILAPMAAISAMRASPDVMSLIAAAAALALCYAGVAVIQSLSPPLLMEADPIWPEARSLLGDVVGHERIAVAGGLPYEALGRVFLFVSALICAIGLSSRGQGGTLLLWFARAGALYAALSVGLFFYDPTHIFWLKKPGYTSDLTGTFIGRNVAASFLGMILTANVALGAAIYGRARAKSAGSRGTPFLSNPGATTAAASVLVCILAILLTSSRAGIILSALSATFTAWMVLGKYIHLPIKRLGLPALALLAVGLTVLSLVNVGERIGGQGLDDEGRWEAYKAIARMIADRPIFGSGLGTFEIAFPQYRMETSIYGVWTRAHSTPLEVIAEVGLPLAILTFTAWGIALYRLGKAAIAMRRSEQVVPLAATVALTLHSFIDFPLQIPGCAVAFAAIFGIGLGFGVNRFEK